MAEYFVPGDFVLANKLGILSLDKLKRVEAKIVFIRDAELASKPIDGAFDFIHLKKIHYHLFSDLYYHAGQVRSVDLAKGDSVFCLAAYIDSMQEGIFTRLKSENLLTTLEKNDFCRSLALLSSDLNALHPFRDGNGRAIRAFLRHLAVNAGYHLELYKVDENRLLEADIAAFFGDHEPLIQVLQTIVVQINGRG